MAELSDADKEFIKELREAKENKSLTRREALSVAGGVLGGGVLGAAGTVETASADASTTDSDGNVGLPDDRVDVYSDGVDSLSIGTDEINTARQIVVGNDNTGQNVFPATTQGLRDALASITTSGDGTGATVEVPAGTYGLGLSGVTVPARVTLRGAGKRRTYITADDGIGTAITLSGSETTVENLSLVRPTTGSDDTGIYAESSGWHWFDGLEVLNFWRGIDLNGASQVWIDNSVITPVSGTGQEAAIVGRTNAGSCEEIWIQNCLFGPDSPLRVVWDGTNGMNVVGCEFEGAPCTAIIKTFGSQSVFANNTIRFNKAGASVDNHVKIQSGSAAVMGTLINDQGDYSSHYGISYGGAPGGRVCDNKVIGVGYAGIQVASNDLVVSGNVCKNNDNNGSGAAYAAGIYLDGVTDCSVVGNRCYDDQTTKTQDYGISSNGGDYNSVTGNTVRGNATSGLNGLGLNSAKAGNVT